MLRSLRFRLPALFLLGIVLAGRRRDADRDPLLPELHAHAGGRGAAGGVGRDRAALRAARRASGRCRSRTSSKAIGGDRIFYVPIVPGASLLAGPLPQLPSSDVVPPASSQRGKPLDASTSHVARRRHYLAVAQPVALGRGPVGALVVAKPDVAAAQPLAARSSSGSRSRSAVGLLVAGLLGVYLSRRITRPLRALSAAADEVAGGQLRRRRCPSARGGDEIAHLVRALRRDGGEARGVGAALAQLPDVGLARAAHAADRDPRPRRRAARGRASTTRRRRSGRSR